MITVGQLAQHLNSLDPTLPIGIIDIDRQPGSQRATVTLRAATDIDITHEPRTGQPQAVWLTAQQLSTAESAGEPASSRPDALAECSPSTVVLASHPCGCLIPIAFAAAASRSVNLDAFSCRHHQPNDLVIRSARQIRE